MPKNYEIFLYELILETLRANKIVFQLPKIDSNSRIKDKLDFSFIKDRLKRMFKVEPGLKRLQRLNISSNMSTNVPAKLFKF